MVILYGQAALSLDVAYSFLCDVKSGAAWRGPGFGPACSNMPSKEEIVSVGDWVVRSNTIMKTVPPASPHQAHLHV